MLKKIYLSISGVGFGTFAATFQPISKDFDQNTFLLSVMQSGTIAEFLTSVFNLSIALGAMFAVLRIGYAGFLYMTTDVIGNKQRAKEILASTTLGLVLLLGVVLILTQVNPDILEFRLNLPSSNPTP